jgi:hypothetical protein
MANLHGGVRRFKALTAAVISLSACTIIFSCVVIMIEVLMRAERGYSLLQNRFGRRTAGFTFRHIISRICFFAALLAAEDNSAHISTKRNV